MPRFVVTPRRAAVASLLSVALAAGVAWGLHALVSSAAGVVSAAGWVGGYFLGLGWLVWGLERAAQRVGRRRLAADGDHFSGVTEEVAGTVLRPAGRRISNPLDPAAWYYGRTGQRLKQTLAALAAWTVVFSALYWLAHLSGVSGVNPYELPAGGGQEVIRQTVQIRKVIRKKFVVNPYSSIKFAPPPLDTIDVKLMEESRNEYKAGQGAEGDGTVGQGDGKGSGFGAGTGKGMVRLIRLRHSDRAWDKNFGVGGDKNLLAEYAARTRQKVAEMPEAIDLGQLAAFPPKKAPPVVYVAGAARFSLSSSETRTLRQYLTERHGMVFGDNVGGQAFHRDFVATMNEVTGVSPVPVARDDRIHQTPYRLPEVPIVVAHGGTVPLGWKVDGRWVAYYHPGALGDAWRDDHAGIRRDIFEMCYQLGVNVLFYAHREYNTWLQSQQP